VRVFSLQNFLLIFVLSDLQFVVPVLVELLVLLDVRGFALFALLLMVKQQLLHLQVVLLLT
jgi:hypothetical protein